MLVQIIHSLEELTFGFYNQFPILRFYEGIFTSVSQGMFVAFNVSLWMMLILAFLLVFFKWWRVRFPLIFAIIELFNGLYHAIVTLITLNYFPGVVSGLFYVPLSLMIF